jgi:ATP-dependent DNA ligase
VKEPQDCATEVFSGRINNSPQTGYGLTADKMAECRWLEPRLVAQIEYAEWTEGDHLRHSKFVALRDDKHDREVGL